MTTVRPIVTATVALRKPNGRPLSNADIAALTAGTILVVQVEARTADEPGEPVVTVGRVFGWVEPAMARPGKALLTGAVRALRAGFSVQAATTPPTPWGEQ